MTTREPGVSSSHRRLNVLHVSVPTTDGVAEVTTGYVRDQLERGWHVTVACPSEGPLGYDVRAAGGRVRWWEAGREPGPAVLGESARLRRIIEAVNPDVVHLHSAKAGLVGRLVVRNRVPTIVQPHGWSFGSIGAGSRVASRRWEQHAARWTTELVCVSEGERRLAEELGINVPTTVLPNGVDLDRFPAQGETERRAARAALGLRSVPTVVCLGRLSLQKGQQDLLSDWPAIRARVPQAELILVGDGPDRDALVRQAARLEGVSLAGRRADVLTWLAAADVVVAPSRWEGMALVPLEAMAASRSVVATDVPGIAESLPEGAGAVVPVADSQAMVDAVATRLLDAGLVEDEGWFGRTHVEQHHDATRAARDLARVYLRLVAARR